MSTSLTGRIGGSSAIADPLTDLEALEALAGAGLAARIGANQWALRTLTAPAAGIAVTAGDGATGNPALALANDLAAVEALSSTGIAVRTATDTWAQRSLAVSGSGLSVSNASGAGGNPTVTIDPAAVVAAGGVPALAAQSDQETSTSTTTFVSPARQQFHPSAAKCWAYVTVSAGTPTLQASYNITSITDTGVGLLTITIGTDFSSANWSATISGASNDAASAINWQFISTTSARAAGSARLVNVLYNTGVVDPPCWDFSGYGDQ